MAACGIEMLSKWLKRHLAYVCVWPSAATATYRLAAMAAVLSRRGGK